MNISVYDTYVQRPDGRRMHFDILVPLELKDYDVVLGFGRAYLAAKGVPTDTLKSEKCNFCHIEPANDIVQAQISARGFAIIEIEHCD